MYRREDADLDPDYSCILRFLAVAGARNDSILSLDDDIVVPKSSLAALDDECKRDPDVIPQPLRAPPRPETALRH